MRDEAKITATAAMQAGLWSERPHDWAECFESETDPWLGPLYEEALDRLDVGAGTSILDVGCGAGRFVRMAADRGATVSAMDVTPAFVTLARERTPTGDVRVGDMQSLPWAEDSFDAVTGFNSFLFAEDLGEALREARRVARPRARLAMTAFGRPEHTDSRRLFELIAESLPASLLEDDEAPPLDRCLRDAGFAVELAGYRRNPERYPDLDTLVRGLLAAGPLRRVVRALGDEQVAEFVRTTYAPYVRTDGSVRVTDEYRLLIARA